MMIEKVIHWGKGAPRRKSKSSVKQAFALNRKPWTCECGDRGLTNEQLGLGSKCWQGHTFHRRRIFSLSLGDWLDPEVPVEWLAEMLDTIRQCDACDWLLLTKRPELWTERVGKAARFFREWGLSKSLQMLCDWGHGNPPKHVWLGTSVEDQQNADKRIPALLQIPTNVRFLSVDPLLGLVDLNLARTKFSSPLKHNLDGTKNVINWVIVGGESGPNARPCNIDWIRSIKDQCQSAGVPVFVKQLGSNPHCECGELPASGFTEMQHTKGGDPDEWPEDLRVREFPNPLTLSMPPKL